MKALFIAMAILIGCAGVEKDPVAEPVKSLLSVPVIEEPVISEPVIEEEEEYIPEVHSVLNKVLSIEELPFYWVKNENQVFGYKDTAIQPVEIKAEVTADGVTETIVITPKIFFITNNSIYFSADFTESFTEDEEGNEVPVIVEKYYQQEQNHIPVEISMLPVVPNNDYLVSNDGRYSFEKNLYQTQVVSDSTQIVSGAMIRNLRVSGYFYGVSQRFEGRTGAFIDVQEGAPGVRDSGLYFWADVFTSLNKVEEAGRMWKF